VRVERGKQKRTRCLKCDPRGKGKTFGMRRVSRRGELRYSGGGEITEKERMEGGGVREWGAGVGDLIGKKNAN